MELVGLSSGLVPTEKVEKDLLEAETKGEEELKKFEKQQRKLRRICWRQRRKEKRN